MKILFSSLNKKWK